MPIRILASLALFAGSLAAGWWLGRRGVLTEPRASRLVRWVVTGPSPVVLCLSFWKMDLRSFDPWLLPLLGLVISASALLPAFWYAKRARLTDPQTGSFLTCAFFSNLGYLGAFTAFALFGETGYALCALYLMFFTPCFYSFGFWTAAHYGRAASPGRAGKTLGGELQLYPFLGMLAGVGLSVSGAPRPAPLELFNHVLIPLDTAVYLTAIGSQLAFESPRSWWRPCLAMSAIKFCYTPLIAWGLVQALQIHGLPRQIVLLESCMPVAVSPLMLPLLFGIDRKLASALWWCTTAAAIPWLLAALPLLPKL